MHTDKGVKCEKTKYHESFEGKGKIEEESSIDITKYKLKYIRGTTKTLTYGYTTQPNITTLQHSESLSNGRTSVSLAPVDAEEVPLNVRKRLVDRHNFIRQYVAEGEEHDGVNEFGNAVIVGEDSSGGSNAIGKITTEKSSSTSEEGSTKMQGNINGKEFGSASSYSTQTKN